MCVHSIYVAYEIYCTTENDIGVDTILVDDVHYKKLRNVGTFHMLNVSVKLKGLQKCI